MLIPRPKILERKDQWAQPAQREADGSRLLDSNFRGPSPPHVEDARHFVRLLRSVSQNPVVYAELPYTEHALDMFHSMRYRYAVPAVTRFVEWVDATTRERKRELPAPAA